MVRSGIKNETSWIGASRQSSMTGFSLIELLVVVALIFILSAISLPYILNYKKLYKSEDQALKVMDLMREASQLALTRRRSMRLEIDLTTNEVLIIDGNGPGNADDRQIKAIPLEPVNEIRMDQIPTAVTLPNPPNYADAVFAVDAIGHLRDATPIIGNRVWQIAFSRDGSVVNPTSNIPTSVNLYIWPPATPGNAAARNNKEVRAITMFGGSGAVRYWKHNGTTFLPYQ